MPNLCFVPGCNTGLPNDRKCYEGKKYPSRFHPPENMIDVWNKKIPRADRDLKKNDVVCELHFHSVDVIKIKKYEDEKGNDIIYPLSKPILKSNAIPSIFPNLPSYLSTTNLKKRKPRVQRKSPIKKNKTYNSSISLNETIIKPMILNEDISCDEDAHLNVPEIIEYNIYQDAKNVKLPGTMWGFHSDGVQQLIFTHVEDILIDKCLKVISSRLV